MKKTLCTVLTALLALCALGSCTQKPAQTPPQETEQDTVPKQDACTQLDASPMEKITYYQNPIMTASTPNAWEGYGFGDPFVMRHGGRYYLYVSTKDGQVGVKCWTSDDLVNWTYAGLCATDERTRGAYAPEVYYYNGYFYMYTSPAGQGHYVLRSTSPTEGFEVVTDNMGMSIDGSVFIDHNGKWYFYTANHGRMMIYDMASPTSMRKGRELPSVSVGGGWTEGPMTVYHDGYYYMTYTGNHVLSRAYRINYAVSQTSPHKFADIPVQNPLLVHTAGDLFGIGHNSMVKGPDLDSYYIVYHSLVNATPNRNMHVDRIAFNGADMQILGPVDGAQQVPDMPDVYHRFETGASLQGWQLMGEFGSVGTGLPLAAGSMIVSEHAFDGDFTAEYHVSYMEKGAQAGAVFAYADKETFGVCYIDPVSQSLCIEIKAGGNTVTEKAALPRSFGEDVRFDCLQSLQIERCGNTYTFYFGDRFVHELRCDTLSGGGIGYAARGGQASFGYIGGTAAVGGRGASDEYHSIGEKSGLIPASHYTQGGFAARKIEGVYATVAPAQSVLNYRVLAQNSGAYDLSVRYATGASEPVTLEFFVDGNAVRTVTLDPSTQLCTAVVRDIPMQKGQHTLSCKIGDGELLLTELHALAHADLPEHAWSFAEIDDGCAYSDGNWRANGALSTSRAPICAKRLYGNANWGDYAAEVTVTARDGVNCGLLVRANNPGAPNFVHQNCTAEDAAGGTDWLQGYFVGIVPDGVVLGKQNYSYSELARASGRYAEGDAHTLRVECRGANIRVFVDGALMIDYTDPDPFMQGMIGVRTHMCAASFENMHVEPID